MMHELDFSVKATSQIDLKMDFKRNKQPHPVRYVLIQVRPATLSLILASLWDLSHTKLNLNYYA